MVGFGKNDLGEHWLIAAETVAFDLEEMFKLGGMSAEHPLARRYGANIIKTFIHDEKLPKRLKRRFRIIQFRFQALVSTTEKMAKAYELMIEMDDEWGGLNEKEYGAELARRLFPDEPKEQEKFLRDFLKGLGD